MNNTSRQQLVRLDQLPYDILEKILDYFDGFELGKVKCLSKQMALLVDSSPIWNRIKCSQDEYYNQLSIKISKNDHNGGELSFMFLPKDELFIQSRPFSISFYFALNPFHQDLGHPGGILFGAQSGHPSRRVWPHYHQQFVIIDKELRLWASFMDHREPSLFSLSYSRWYNLTITFDGHTERNYLDGKMYQELTGSIHREWYFLSHAQLGTGCISGDYPLPNPKPTSDFLGWYGFHGLLDTVIIYDRVLTSDQVLQKYKGYYRVDVERSEDQQDGRMIYGPYHFARHVNATRPLELLSKVYSMKLMDL